MCCKKCFWNFCFFTFRSYGGRRTGKVCPSTRTHPVGGWSSANHSPPPVTWLGAATARRSVRSGRRRTTNHSPLPVTWLGAATARRSVHSGRWRTTNHEPTTSHVTCRCHSVHQVVHSGRRRATKNNPKEVTWPTAAIGRRWFYWVRRRVTKSSSKEGRERGLSEFSSSSGDHTLKKNCYINRTICNNTGIIYSNIHIQQCSIHARVD
jgi:hypothetical protein